MQYEIVTSKFEAAVYLENDPTSHYDGQQGSDEALEVKVNTMIAQGWKPLGGVSMSVIKRDYDAVETRDSWVMFSQAMIKE